MLMNSDGNNGTVFKIVNGIIVNLRITNGQSPFFFLPIGSFVFFLTIFLLASPWRCSARINDSTEAPHIQLRNTRRAFALPCWSIQSFKSV